MAFVEALGKLNIDLADKKITLEQRTQKIDKLTKKFLSKLLEKQDIDDYEFILKAFKAVVPDLNQLIDIIFMDTQKLGCELLFVSGVISYFLKQSPRFLRKEKCMAIYESLMLLACKLFNRVRLTFDLLISESIHLRRIEEYKPKMDSQVPDLPSESEIKAQKNEAVAIVMELQYVISDFLIGLNNYRKTSFRQQFLVPELFNSIDLFFKFLNQEWDFVEGYYANVEDRAIDLQNILVILVSLAKEDYSLVQGLKRRIKVLKKNFENSEEETLKQSKLYKKVVKLLKKLNKAHLDELDLVTIPVTRIREYQPKIFDIEDRKSAYNIKYKEKVVKERQRRITKGQYRDLALDSKIVEKKQRDKQDMIEARKKKKYGELMRYIQEQQEEIKKEGTITYKYEKRKKRKGGRMAGNKTAKNQKT